MRNPYYVIRITHFLLTHDFTLLSPPQPAPCSINFLRARSRSIPHSGFQRCLYSGIPNRASCIAANRHIPSNGYARSSTDSCPYTACTPGSICCESTQSSRYAAHVCARRVSIFTRQMELQQFYTRDDRHDRHVPRHHQRSG